MKARRVGAPLPEFRDGLAGGHPFPIPLDEERADALVFPGRVDRGKNGHIIGNAGVGDPVLRSVQDVVVPALFGLAAHSRHVRTHERFGGGKTDALELAGEERKNPFLQRLIARQHERRHAEGVVEHGGRDAGTGCRNLFREKGAFEKAEPAASILCRDIAVDETRCEGLLQQEEGNLVLLVVMPCRRQDLPNCEGAHIRLQFFLLWCQVKIQHDFRPPGR